jgi:hypothetical protein
MSDYDVTPRPDGKWQATTPGTSRPSSVTDTQAEARADATRFARGSGGGEVRIHGTDGRIRNSNTIGKPDPFPPRDTRH